MSEDIEVFTRYKSEVAIIHIKGDVTGTAGEAIEQAYQQVSAEGVQKILLVFDKECYINSGGIAILIGMVTESQEQDQIIRMTGISDHFCKIFEMVGLSRYIEVFPSEATALDDF